MLPESSTWAALDSRLEQALRLEGTEREHWLAQLDRNEPTLTAALRQVLAADPASQALDRVAHSPLYAQALLDLSSLPLGTRVGDWTLCERIGTGGMSEVFLAERMHGGTRQRAALKLLAPGMGGARQSVRFARECAILATLTDARIARYYDSGLADDGRPWLAMEHVDGEPIDRHLDRVPGRIQARVVLLLELAGAVAHAHRHLIVHRDLKPNNVLVTREGQLKLIDFGIASALDQVPVAQATALDARLLTLDYASPEQLRGDSVTTASDVYQLGLLLYLIVAGAHPYAAVSGDRLAMTRAVLELDPEAPSRCLRRRGDHEAARIVNGDLDAIVLMCLAKAPTDRYGSVDALASDLGNWLQGRPVQASGTGRWQRAVRFIKRHRISLTVSTLAACATLAFAGAWLHQTLRANAAAGTSQAVLSLFEQILHTGGYGVDPQPVETVSALLDVAQQRAQDTLADQPAALARTLLLIGQTRVGRGEYLRAASVLKTAGAVVEQDPIDADVEAAIYHPLVNALHFSGQYEEALAWARIGLRRTATEYSGARIALLVAHVDLVHSLGDYAGAETSARQAVDLAVRSFGSDDSRTANAWQMLAMVLRDRGAFEQAEHLLQQVLTIERQVLPPMHVKLAVSLDHQTLLQLYRGNLEAAQRFASEVTGIREHLYQPGFLGRTWSGHRNGLVSMARGDIMAAVEGLDAVVTSYARELGDRSHITAMARSDLAWALLALGRAGEAQNQWALADAMMVRFAAGRHPRRSEILMGQSLLALAAGDHTQAQELAGLALSMRERHTVSGHPALVSACRLLLATGGDCETTEPPATALAWRQLSLAAEALAITL